MFIYEFMSGVVDSIGADDQEIYDPHIHRKVAKPTTYSETMIHLLKGSIGAGILAMPEAVSKLGLAYSVVGIVIIGIFATYCIHLLIADQYELCKRRRVGYMAYPKSMKTAVQTGPKFMRWTANGWPYFVNFVLVFWQLGLCCVYAVFVAQNIKQVCDFYGFVVSVRIHLLYLLIPFIIVGIPKDLKLLTPISSISNLITLFGLVLVFYYLLEDDLVYQDELMRVKGLMEIPIFVGITLFALEAVGVILALEYNMDNPKKFVGLFGLFNAGMLFILLLYMLVGVFGYFKYHEDMKASITLNLPPNEKKAQAAKVIFALAIFLSFPLQNFVAYNIAWRKLTKRVSDSYRTIADYLLRLLFIVLPWLLAVAIPELGPFISLFGALCLSLLAIILPGVMDMCIWYPDQYGICLFRLWRDLFIIVTGIFCLISGVYTSILEIVEAMANNPHSADDYNYYDE